MRLRFSPAFMACVLTDTQTYTTTPKERKDILAFFFASVPRQRHLSSNMRHHDCDQPLI
jgi:hypothetical protein